MVLEIREHVTTIDTSMTYFQAPFTVEDALGFKFPIPSEYDYDMMETIIRRRFKEGTASQEVLAGDYELCKTTKRSETITANSRILPGTFITMAIIVNTPTPSLASCPIARCGSSVYVPCPGGGFTWYVFSTAINQALYNRRLIALHVMYGLTKLLREARKEVTAT